MMWWDGRTLEVASNSPRVVRSQKNEFFFRKVGFGICSGVADGLQQGSDSALCTPGGEALTVPVLPFPGEGTRCHCQGGRGLPWQVRVSVPPCVPSLVDKHRVLQCPAETAAGASGRLQGATSWVVQTTRVVLPSLPLPHHKGAAPAAFPRNSAVLGCPAAVINHLTHFQPSLHTPLCTVGLIPV